MSQYVSHFHGNVQANVVNTGRGDIDYDASTSKGFIFVLFAVFRSAPAKQ